MHLAGENIAGGRWTEGRKAFLRSSRVGPTRLLAETLRGLRKKPKVLVSASATGCSGSRGRAWMTETDPPARKARIRVVHARIGIVLSPAGGALRKMLLPLAGLGGTVGPGTQYMSWIALDDLLGVIHHLLDRTSRGR